MSRGKYSFDLVPTINTPRSTFDRSNDYKTTFDAGYLIPFFYDEVYPGDTFKVSPTFFGRMLTPIVAVMDNIFLDWFFFYVPERLVWSNFEKHMGSQENPGDSTDYLIPQITSPEGGFLTSTIYDYFTIPPNIGGLSFSALYFRAYNLIWNEWFRDENLQDSVDVPKDDGPDDPSLYTLLRRGRRKDYFMGALPWPQKGPGVEIPIVAGDAPVRGNGLAFGLEGAGIGTRNLVYANDSGSYTTKVVAPAVGSNFTATYNASASTGSSGTNSVTLRFPTNPSQVNLVADLSKSTFATIDTLRTAFQMQRFLEKDARGGTRYTELLRSHFNVISPDARLQRPEFLGGGETALSINPVVQSSATGQTGAATPQGNVSAYATFGSTGKGGFVKSFVEHGFIIGLFSVRTSITYQQGLSRLFSRRTRYDRYWPVFAHLGEQAILNKEIYAQGSSVVDDLGNVVDDKVFGYQERWAELRYKPSVVTGLFRSQSLDAQGQSNTLDIWHLALDFDNLPTLSSEFIEDNPPVERVLAVPDEPDFMADIHVKCKCTRPMPLYSVPGLIDHF